MYVGMASRRCCGRRCWPPPFFASRDDGAQTPSLLRRARSPQSEGLGTPLTASTMSTFAGGISMSALSTISRVDWFERVFGFRENAGTLEGYAQAQEKFNYDPSSGVLQASGGKFFKAGTFETPRLADLRQRSDAVSAEVRELLGGKLRVREEIADVSALHTLPENQHALFQAASQFNTLEHVCERGLPEQGITCYASDRTQGPACATACAPGLVVRNYFAFPDGGGQTESRQIENLRDVEEALENSSNKYFRVQSGYTLSFDRDLEGLCRALEDPSLQERVRSELRVGIQSETQVVCSRFGAELFEGDEQLVTQVYASAVAVSYSGCSPLLWEPFARLVLEASYEATLHAAVENALRHEGKHGSRRVFLTALGGGVFGNAPAWIEDAMRKAFDKFQHLDLEVVLVSYGVSTPFFAKLASEHRSAL